MTDKLKTGLTLETGLTVFSCRRHAKIVVISSGYVTKKLSSKDEAQDVFGRMVAQCLVLPDEESLVLRQIDESPLPDTVEDAHDEADSSLIMVVGSLSDAGLNTHPDPDFFGSLGKPGTYTVH